MQTGDRFSSVWGDKAYYGRVRDWDGLVLLFSVAGGACLLLMHMPLMLVACAADTRGTVTDIQWLYPRKHEPC
ncbi:hypothetical protein JB92DRAFT_2994782, partial [Gautieria morchelliformis]